MEVDGAVHELIQCAKTSRFPGINSVSDRKTFVALCRQLTTDIEKLAAGDMDDDLPKFLKPRVARGLLDVLEKSIPSLSEYVRALEDESEEEAEDDELSEAAHVGPGTTDASPEPVSESSDGEDSGGPTVVNEAPKRARKPPRRADADVVAAAGPEVPLTETGPCPTSKLTELWRTINAHKMAVIFRKPVNRTHAPGYDDVIKQPMDLTEILHRIERGEVTTIAAMRKLMYLICHNAMVYNGQVTCGFVFFFSPVAASFPRHSSFRLCVCRALIITITPLDFKITSVRS
jgi:hypothetical protein